LKSLGILNTEGEVVLEPKGVLESMKFSQSCIKNFQDSARLAKNIQPLLNAAKNFHSVSDTILSVQGAVQAAAALHAVTGGTYCPSTK
jgi:hypothetical protein